MASDLLYHFSEVDKYDTALVGVKGGTLGEMAASGLPLPDGFIIASSAYFQFLREHGLTTKINHLLGTVNFSEPTSILQVASHIQNLINASDMQDTLIAEILHAYKNLGMLMNAPVALRASITSDALPSPSFAGPQETSLFIEGERALLTKIKAIWASLFAPKAIYYRHEKHYDHFRIGMAVIVQKMIVAEKSGTLFSVNPLTHDKSHLIIEAKYGQPRGENNELIPNDRYEVDKKSFSLNHKAIVEQDMMFEKVGPGIHTVRVPEHKKKVQKLTEQELASLIHLGIKAEAHYYFPLALDFAIEKKTISILNLRPLTLHPTTPEADKRILTLTREGLPLSHGIVTGHCRLVTSYAETEAVQPGEIVLLRSVHDIKLDSFKKAGGVAVESSDVTPVEQASLRTIGIPVVIGVLNLFKLYKTGDILTVNSATGTVTPGGHLSPRHVSEPQRAGRSIATKLFLSYSEETKHKDSLARSAADGITDVSLETILGMTHPKKLIRDGNKEALTFTLLEELATIARSFHPRPVIIKTTDFTSSFYKTMQAGKTYESAEENPAIGYRGGIRLLHDPEVFNLQLEAIKRARNTLDLKNIWLMLSYVRSPEEFTRIKKMIAAHSLLQSASFKIWLSLDTPSNIVQLEEYCKVGVDGLNLNTDSLGMLFTGTDPHNSDVSSTIHEENTALLQAYHYTIKQAHKHGLPVMMSGKRIAHMPSLIEKLVLWGASGLVVPNSSLENIRQTIYKYERKLLT